MSARDGCACVGLAVGLVGGRRKRRRRRRGWRSVSLLEVELEETEESAGED